MHFITQKPVPPVEFESVSPNLLLPPYMPGPNQLKSFMQVRVCACVYACIFEFLCLSVCACMCACLCVCVRAYVTSSVPVCREALQDLCVKLSRAV